MFSMQKKMEAGQVYIIAEMSANHGGSLKRAREIVEAAAAAGADCVKVQAYTADTITAPGDPEIFGIREGLWAGQTLYDLYTRAATPWEWFPALQEECNRWNVDFLATPFDATAVDYLEQIGCGAYKIASFELVDLPLIRYAAGRGKPMLLSCGMASPEEIGAAVETCRQAGNDRIVLLKCCSEYPTPWAHMNLRNIPDMRRRFGLPVGLSDHSAGDVGAIAAVALGACVVEKHFMLEDAVGEDAAFSMRPEEFARMVRRIRAATQATGGPDYTLSDSEKASLRYRRSLFTARSIRAGETLGADDLCSLRPACGLPPAWLPRLVGCRARHDIPRWTPVRLEDFIVPHPTEEKAP